MSAELAGAWELWNSISVKVGELMNDGKYKVALNELEKFHPPEGDSSLQISFLNMRAGLKSDIGDFQGAKEDWLVAESLAAPGFARHVIETALAETFLSLGSKDQAKQWYRAALQTCTHSDFPGGAALKRYLELTADEELQKNDWDLCAQVAQLSWQRLSISGNPDLSRLREVARTLVEKERAHDRKK